MNFRLAFHFAGIVLLITAVFMLLPVGAAFYYGQGDALPLLLSLVITLITGLVFSLATRRQKKEDLRPRDGFFIVTFSWFAASAAASFPYLISGVLPSFTDAFFEAAAGLTTTGSTVLADIESVPNGILLWRSITQWMGGMGIILFAIAILPMLGTGGMQLFKAEVPELTVDKLRPRIVDTAKALWYIYVLLTVSAGLLYGLGGMSPYDALSHAFTTLATGGFSTKNASMAYFRSPFIESVATLFMFLAGINYSLYYFVFRGHFLKIWRSNEFRFYLGVTLTAICALTLYNYNITYPSILESLRYASFQVVSIMTTTGYATADYELWAPFSQILLIVLMFFGGMIGSTGGGMKQVRILLMFKQIYREFYHLIHPRAVTFVKLDDRELPKEVLGSVWGFLFLFLLVWVAATVLLAALGVDIVTASSTAISALSNVGPALGDAGPAEHYAFIPSPGKWVLAFCMIVGRLEVFTVMVLFMPHFWKK